MRFTGAAALAALLTLAACAAEPVEPPVPPTIARPPCLAWDAGQARARGFTVAEVPEAAAFIRAYNAHPPQSDASGDRVMALRRDGPVTVVFIAGACVTGVGQVSPTLFDALMGEGV
jgi:hypothetical protein